MSEKEEYLRKYNKDVRMICEGIEELLEIPESWREILREADFAIKKSKMLSLWRLYASPALSNTIQYLEENLKNLELIQYRDKYSLLYTIKAANGSVSYYEGRNPMGRRMPEELQDCWKELPPTIQAFYENLHDGFFYYASESMGLLPLQDVVVFDDEDWGILEELEEPLQLDLKSTFGLFASGMGGYVAVDASDCRNDNATLWYTNRQPRYHINFWDVVDEWIVIGFQG